MFSDTWVKFMKNNDGYNYCNNAWKSCYSNSEEIKKQIMDSCQEIMTCVSSLPKESFEECSAFLKNMPHSLKNPSDFVNESHKLCASQFQRGMDLSNQVYGIVADAFQKVADQIKAGLSHSSECHSDKCGQNQNNDNNDREKPFHKV